MGKYIIGIDVGGTNIKLGLINQSGRIIFRTALITKSFVRSKKKLIDILATNILKAIKGNGLLKKDIIGIGIGLPGSIDADKGVVRNLTNIFGWRDVPLKKILEGRLHIPVFIDNDVNLVTLGEWKYGAGRGYKNMICITLGTGVGGGLILNNALYRGEGFAAGEIGHVPINEKGPKCNCGGYGCLENYVGSKYLLRKARNTFKRKDILLKDIDSLAAKGNQKAVSFWKETAEHLGNGLTGVVNIINPRCIVIGGGISGAYRYLSKTIQERITSRAMKVQGNMVKIVKAKLGNDAGIIGAYALVKDAVIPR